MSEAVDAYLAHMGITPAPVLKHYGRKGMKWGVRKDRRSSGESKHPKKELSAEQKATRKKVIVGASIAAAILATAAVAYVGYDQHTTNSLKEVLSVGESNFENVRKSSHGDKLIKAGAEFTRRSYAANAGWPTDIRTYAAEGPDNALIEKYGNKLYKFTTTRDIKVAGLRTQLDILQSPDADAIRKATAKEYARYSLSGQKFVKELNESQFSKLTIENLRRSAWDGGETGSQTAKLYSDFIKRNGYAAVEDLNLPGTAARVLLDKSAFALGRS